jgi:hypothetical protein
VRGHPDCESKVAVAAQMAGYNYYLHPYVPRGKAYVFDIDQLTPPAWES